MRMRCNSRSGGASITARVLQRILIHHSDSIPSSAASSLPRVQPHSSATLVVEPEVMLELRKEIQRLRIWSNGRHRGAADHNYGALTFWTSHRVSFFQTFRRPVLSCMKSEPRNEILFRKQLTRSTYSNNSQSIYV